MKKLTTLIVDDEVKCRRLLEEMLAERGDIKPMTSAEDVDQAIRALEKEIPDLILLDIQMPMKDGFTLVEYIHNNKINSSIVFVTAYDSYAIKAVKASAFDYLLKPVVKDELFASIDRLKFKKVDAASTNKQVGQIVHELKTNIRLRFSDKNGYFFILVNELLYLKSDGNYTHMFTTEHQEHTLSSNLGKVELSLPQDKFIRISRFLIVNIQFLKRINRKTGYCHLVYNDFSIELPLSRRYTKRVEEELNKLLCNQE